MADIRLESFPFDSDFDGYDDKGYPVYDRAVDARTYRSSLEQFFSDGVFGTPANALQIGKGSGLSVTIQPGIGIIRGAIGGVFEDPVTLELDAEPPQGNIAYSIMLRCDDNDDRRSMFLTVVKGTADTDPTPPAPTDSALIKDLRLGYVVVPSGATDLASATVTNEKGLSVCPYAAPFEEIDVDGIVSDFRVAANEALTNLLEYFQSYEGVVDSALSGTEAGYLQQQITAIQEQLANTDLSGIVDDVTIEYDTAAGEIAPKLRVKDGGLSAGKLASNAVDGSTIVNDGALKVPNGGITWDQLSDDIVNFIRPTVEYDWHVVATPSVIGSEAPGFAFGTTFGFVASGESVTTVSQNGVVGSTSLPKGISHGTAQSLKPSLGSAYTAPDGSAKYTLMYTRYKSSPPYESTGSGFSVSVTSGGTSSLDYSTGSVSLQARDYLFSTHQGNGLAIISKPARTVYRETSQGVFATESASVNGRVMWNGSGYNDAYPSVSPGNVMATVSDGSVFFYSSNGTQTSTISNVAGSSNVTSMYISAPLVHGYQLIGGVGGSIGLASAPTSRYYGISPASGINAKSTACYCPQADTILLYTFNVSNAQTAYIVGF